MEPDPSKKMAAMGRHIPEVMRHAMSGRQLVSQCLQRLHHQSNSASETLPPFDWERLLESFSSLEYQMRLLNEDVDSNAAKQLRNFVLVPRVGKKRAAGRDIDDPRKAPRVTTVAQAEALQVVPSRLSSMPHPEIGELDRVLQRKCIADSVSEHHATGREADAVSSSSSSSSSSGGGGGSGGGASRGAGSGSANSIASHNNSVTSVMRGFKRRLATWHDDL